MISDKCGRENTMEGQNVIKNERIQWIDIGRGIGILLVILGHAVSGPVREVSGGAELIYNFIYFFHMGLLMYLSGYMYKKNEERYLKKGIKKVIGNKFKQLMIPYIVYSFLVFLVFSGAHKIEKLSAVLSNSDYGQLSFVKWFMGMGIGNNIYSIHLWYIYALFVMIILTLCIKKVFGKKSRLCVVLTAIVFYLIKRNINLDDMGIINHVMTNYYWFAIGMCIDLETIGKNKVKIIAIICLIYRLITINMPIRLPGTIGVYVMYVVNIFAAVGIIFGFLLIAKKVSGKVKSILMYLGKNSFGIYLFHQPFWGSGIGMICIKVLHAPPLIAVIAAMVLSILIPIIIIKILNTPLLKKVSFLLLGSK